MIRSRNRIQRAEYEAQNEMHLATAARVTAELVNVVGALGAGKKWKPVRPAQYFEAWTGSKGAQPTADEVRKAEAEIERQIQERESVVLARRRAKALAETQPESDAQG